MTIRRRFLVLLLLIALGPMIVAAVLHRAWMYGLGRRLASGTRESLTAIGSNTREGLDELAADTRDHLIDDARAYLQQAVDGFGRILAREKELLELALRYQARAAEHCLAQRPPASPRLVVAGDYDAGRNLPADMAPSTTHFRAGADGTLAPLPVSYGEQVYYLAGGVARSAVAADMARLSAMPQAYRVVYESKPDLMYWQYTSLESGLHTCYPGHGGYPADYDPRKRLWYRRTKERGELLWHPPLVEVSTRSVTLGLSMPVRRPDGSFAGATAIDVPVRHLFDALALPEPWAEESVALVVAPGWNDETFQGKGKLVVLAEKGREERREDWQNATAWRFFESDDPGQVAALLRDADAGRSGVRRMAYRGCDAVWAYGAGAGGAPFPIVIVPCEQIVARAAQAERAVRRTTEATERYVQGKTDEAEQYVLDTTSDALKITGAILLGVIAIVVGVALRRSRLVTEPIQQLAREGRKLADGDFEARVDIRTGDELEELGRIFNATGPMLKERERMKQSLALAMEIQQHLLPPGPPSLDGFDIAGRSDYCDETGGDYYDFIDLVDLGHGKLGIAVGDVTGHGIGPALLMASARAVLRSHAVAHGADLAALFNTLNHHLVRDTGDERFITLFYGLLDATTRTLRWTSAGHDPPLWLRRASGRIEELPNTGIPLGVLDGAVHEQAGPITLEPLDVVVIGTDGIWETHNPAGEQFGKGRLRGVLEAHAHLGADAIHGAIVDAVQQFRAAEPQRDDITLVVLKAL